MDPLYLNGIRLISGLQRVEWLEAPMRFFTFLGTADFFFLFLPAVYWCIDSRLGARIGFILLFSHGFNEITKLAFQGPRPYWFSGEVRALAAESTFGVPSGHAQLAAGVWGIIAGHVGRAWAWITAIFLILLIGLSRLYLAVHFPQDVLLGWLLGGLTLWAFLTLWERAAAWTYQRRDVHQVMLVLGVAAGMILISGLQVYALRGYVLPAEWAHNSQRAGEGLPTPVSMEGALTSAGALVGLALGLIWIQNKGGFQPSGPAWRRSLCFLVGCIGVLGLYLGLKAVFPSDSSLIGHSLRFVRYAAIGAWISAGAPLLFARLKLLENSTR